MRETARRSKQIGARAFHRCNDSLKPWSSRNAQRNGTSDLRQSGEHMTHMAMTFRTIERAWIVGRFVQQQVRIGDNHVGYQAAHCRLGLVLGLGQIAGFRL